MTTNATMVDPQSAMGVILRPPAGFEALYQGQSGATPIPFVSAPFLALDELAGKPLVASTLVRFEPVPIGGTGLIVIPRALFADGATLRAPSYVYDLRWRLRTVHDNVEQVTLGNATHPYSLNMQSGAPSTPAPLPREVLPAYTSESLTPAVVGVGTRPLVASGVYGTVSQGIYSASDFAGMAGVTGADVALGPNYFPPYLRAMLGNELGIVATKSEGTWDFTDTGATGDAAFSSIYGTNVAGTQHPPYPGVGIVLIMLARPGGE